MTKIISNVKGFIFLLIALIALTAIIGGSSKKKIEKIVLKNNIRLNAENYLSFAMLDDKTKYEGLTLLLIKDKLEKHPYIEKCDVLYKGKGIVEVEIFEVPFYALLMQNGKEKILTEDGELLPKIEGTKYLNLPVILVENTKNPKKMKKQLTDALKVLKASELYNSELYGEISSIDLTKSESVILTMSDTDYPVILDRNKILDNVLAFCNLYSSLKNKEDKSITYIDLRFNNHVFIGTQKVNAMGVKELL